MSEELGDSVTLEIHKSKKTKEDFLKSSLVGILQVSTVKSVIPHNSEVDEIEF